MKNLTLLLLVLLICPTAWSQPGIEATQGTYSLNERYGIMKSKSQTFKDYKVIKETVLDGVWKIVLDSLHTKNAALRTAKQNIDTLNSQVKGVQLAMAEKEKSVADIVHASTHIGVLGIDFNKGAFITGVLVVVAALVFVLGVLSTRMKLLSKSLQERKLAINMITHEYEDYKRRAMDKQTKLSRELQDERNKLQSLRNS